jgi:hypothetical protein
MLLFFEPDSSTVDVGRAEGRLLRVDCHGISLPRAAHARPIGTAEALRREFPSHTEQGYGAGKGDGKGEKRFRGIKDPSGLVAQHDSQQ